MSEGSDEHGAAMSMGQRGLGRPQWLLALGGWTVFVWGQRISNVVVDDDLSGFAQLWRLAVAVAFVVVGAVVVFGVARGRGSTPAWVSSTGVGLAVFGSAWWILRGGQILIGDWDTSFKAVHTGLAVVVVGLSVMVWRSRGYARPSYG